MLFYQLLLLELLVDAFDQAFLGGGLEPMHRHVHLDDLRVVGILRLEVLLGR